MRQRYYAIIIFLSLMAVIGAILAFMGDSERLLEDLEKVLGEHLADIILGSLFVLISYILGVKLNQAVKKIEEITTNREEYVQEVEKPSLSHLLRQAIIECGEMISSVSGNRAENFEAPIGQEKVLKLLVHMNTIRDSIIDTRLIAPDKTFPITQIDDIIHALAFKEIKVSNIAEFQGSLTMVLESIEDS